MVSLCPRPYSARWKDFWSVYLPLLQNIRCPIAADRKLTEAHAAANQVYQKDYIVHKDESPDAADEVPGVRIPKCVWSRSPFQIRWFCRHLDNDILGAAI